MLTETEKKIKIIDKVKKLTKKYEGGMAFCTVWMSKHPENEPHILIQEKGQHIIVIY